LGFKNEFASFEKSGLVAQYSVARRKKLGLPLNRPQLDDLKQIIEELPDKKYRKKEVEE
jgi:hypothetical protein